MSIGAEVCESCYAKSGTYRFPVVKALRVHNRNDYKAPDWTARMIAACSKYDMIRLFDSGDCETVELAEKLYTVILSSPEVAWWLPTRMDKSTKVKTFLDRIAALPNVSVRLSADHIGLDQPERDGVNSYVIRPTDLFEAAKRNLYICPATTGAQKSCGSCTHCYGSEPVAYMIH